jgi:hypothetical protein
MTKPLEFVSYNTTGNPWGPLIVIISRNSIEVSTQLVPNHPDHLTYAQVMTARLWNDLMKKPNTPKNETIEEEWTRRRKALSAKKPHCLEDPEHIPIVLREGEEIEFRCTEAYPFSAWIGREPWVKKETNGPEGPDYAGNHNAQMFLNNVGRSQINMPDANGGPADQRFYKVHAFLYTSGGTIAIDPDGICDR